MTRNITADAVTGAIGVYIIYAIVSALVSSDPSFGRYGWPIVGATLISIIAYIRSRGK